MKPKRDKTTQAKVDSDWSEAEFQQRFSDWMSGRACLIRIPKMITRRPRKPGEFGLTGSDKGIWVPPPEPGTHEVYVHEELAASFLVARGVGPLTFDRPPQWCNLRTRLHAAPAVRDRLPVPRRQEEGSALSMVNGMGKPERA